MTAESTADDDSLINSMLSKRHVTMKKITMALVLLLKLFFSYIHCVQNTLFVLPTFYQAPQKTCETFAGRTLFKNRNPSRAAQFLDVGRSLHTPGLNHLSAHDETSNVLKRAVKNKVAHVLALGFILKKRPFNFTYLYRHIKKQKYHTN